MDEQFFDLLNQQQREMLLPELYAIAEKSGRTAVFAGDAPCETYADWRARITAALDDPQRYILLMRAEGGIAGYMQYSLQGEVILLEYAVVDPVQQGTPLFRHCFRYLLQHLPPEILYLDDYVSKDRPEAIKVNQKLGMEILGETHSGTHVRMRAKIPDVRGLF